MLRRLSPHQPESFEFTPANLDWAKAWIAKYPEGRQASAVIPLLWRAQEQEGWVTRPAIEYIANMLGMAEIRVLEVATFYFMFQLQPIGKVAHFQICGTTSCMICGAEDLIAVCKRRIAANPHEISADGRFSWEEVECLGACANAPMAQIGKDYYEDLTAEGFETLLDEFEGGAVPRPGSQIGRFSSEPLDGLSSLTEGERIEKANGSVTRAMEHGDTIASITGEPVTERASFAAPIPKQPETLPAPRAEGPDDLKIIKGIGPVLEEKLHGLGYYHFDQIAGWTDAEIAWVDTHLDFHGRVIRERWVEQARVIVAETAAQDA
ncbi:NADH-quinone oxidoreductase subunit NuoE [Amaricoccus solimangrovi]|uniref:NADH-quinone oxidoreductase subunit NuoE n=1 Tax=Amaricoccus solimangrovi TaxID=2589815 RepID=A0A501WVU0_9RHOB|nr:NADH-quinone oxidoreductase subunit NuoE [Amaricoccus solimangrovi]TPE53873.1 NADH-quinone oxidoreductase subunit NuoE [Amaricoccus solimangrovi]